MMVLVSLSFSRCVNFVGRGQLLVLVLNLLVLVSVLEGLVLITTLVTAIDMILEQPGCCVPRLTQPSTLRGTVKLVSSFGLSNNKWRWWMLVLQPTGGLTAQAQVGWLGLRVSGHLALPYIRQMNRVNYGSDCHDDSTINIVDYYYYYPLMKLCHTVLCIC